MLKQYTHLITFFIKLYFIQIGMFTTILTVLAPYLPLSPYDPAIFFKENQAYFYTAMFCFLIITTLCTFLKMFLEYIAK